MIPLLLGLVISLFVVRSVASTLRQFYLLRHIPGPRIAGFTKWWLLRRVAGGRTHMDLYEVTQKYGSIARIGPNDLVTSEPELMKRMLNVRTSYKRSDWYDAMRLDPSKDNVLSMRDDAAHSQLRAKMAAGYSGKEIDRLEEKIDYNIRSLIHLLENKYISANKAFDFGHKAQFFTMDVISDIGFGEPFGFLATDSDRYEYIATAEEKLPSIISTTVYPRILRLLMSPLMKSLLPSDKDPIGMGKLIGIAKQKANERFGPNKKVQRDMLGSFVAHGLTLEEAGSEILLQVLAGSDTTATAIRSTMLLLMSNARVVNKLRAEIAARAPATSSGIITDAQARAMPYLQAVIKEGLRVHPPVTGLMLKEVPARGDKFNGMHFPEGTRIGYCAWGVMRREDVWGADAAEFRPERWLEASPEKQREMESVLELTFSYGRWQCLGRNIALIELNKVFVELLRRHDFAVVDPMQPWKSTNVGIFMQSDFWVRAFKLE